MPRLLLTLVFTSFFCMMLAQTVRATLARSLFDNGHLMGDVWFQATLLDAYLGFLTFYLWVAWKERTIPKRIGWFVLIMTLGNMAMAGYVLLQLRGLDRDATVSDLLTKRVSV